MTARQLAVAHLDTARTWRGGQAQALLLMTGLERRGVHNVLLAPTGPLLARAAAAGIRTVAWRAHGEWDLGALAAAALALRRASVHVVHAHGARSHAIGVPAARIAGVPAVVVSRRVDFQVGRNPLSALKYRMPVDRYLCVSRGVVEVMRAAGIPEARLALVPDGIEIADPAPGPDLRSLLGLDAATPIVGTVAALAPHKNHRDLLDAAAHVTQVLPDVHFVWVGEGKCRASLERQRAALGLERRVHLLGFRSDALALLRQFTVFALSSWLEGLCTSLLDAQALGVPVVATAVGGIPEVVQDGVNGRLVPVRDPRALAMAIVEAVADPWGRERWAAEGRRTVEAFHIDRTIDRTLDEYLNILAQRRTSAWKLRSLPGGPGNRDARERT